MPMTTLSDGERAVLRVRLDEAEKALHALMIGKSAVSIAYDGESVTYGQADEAKLRRYIADLKSQLGDCEQRLYRPGVRV
jgi:hypothetical protein